MNNIPFPNGEVSENLHRKTACVQKNASKIFKRNSCLLKESRKMARAAQCIGHRHTI